MRVRLGAAAESDFITILRWTTKTFGRGQALIYRETLMLAIGALMEGAHIAGSQARDEILAGLRTLHVARGGRRGRLFLLYRAAEDGAIEILRILHDEMDLPRHVPFADDQNGP